MSKQRHINFTIFHQVKNNDDIINVWTPDSFNNFIRDLFNNNNDIEYLVYQHERGSETEKDHVQGFIQFKSRKSFKYIKKIFNDKRMHIDYANGSVDDNIKYCTKEYNRYKKSEHKRKCKCDFFDISKSCDLCINCERSFARIHKFKDIAGPFEFGDPILKYEKFKNVMDEYIQTKLEENTAVKELIKSINQGMSFEEAVINYADRIPSWLKTISGLKEYNRCLNELNKLKYISVKKWQPCNIFLSGDSETGKSYFTKCFNIACYKTNEKYWNEYDNQDTIIMNEFYKGGMEWDTFLKITEKDDILVKVKNKSPINVVSKYNIFTSNRSLEQIMKFDNASSWFRDKTACLRRFKPPYGYMIRLEGSYPNGLVRWIFEEGDKKQFFLQELIITFNKCIKTINDAKLYVYDDEFINLFESNERVYLKKKIFFLSDNDIIIEENDITNIVINENFDCDKRNMIISILNEDCDYCYKLERIDNIIKYQNKRKQNNQDNDDWVKKIRIS